MKILGCKPKTTIINSNIPTFCIQGFKFIYTYFTTPDKMFKARSTKGNFVGMKIDEIVSLIFETVTKTIIIFTRLDDFNSCTNEALPGMNSLQD